MDLHSESESEVEVLEIEETTMPVRRKCGTPGCDLADFHLGPCTSWVRSQAGSSSTSTWVRSCTTQLVIGPEKQQLGETEAEADDAEEEAETDATERARRQAEAEGLTLKRKSSNETGYKGVLRNHKSCRFHARVRRAGTREHLGSFNTAEEAALAVARFNAARSATRIPAATSRLKAAKRAAPPPKPQRATQARKATANHPEQAVPPPAVTAPAASPAAAEQAVPPPTSLPAETLLQKVGRIKAALELDSTLLLVDAIKAANELMEIAPAAGAGYPSQCDTLLAAIGV